MFIFALVKIQFVPVYVQTRALTTFAEIVPKTPVAPTERVFNIEATRTFGETARDVCVPINPKPVR